MRKFFVQCIEQIYKQQCSSLNITLSGEHGECKEDLRDPQLRWKLWSKAVFTKISLPLITTTQNSELHDELPALHDSRILFLVTNMQTLFAAEEVFHSETAKVTATSQTVDDFIQIFAAKESFSVSAKRKMSWKGRGSLHDLLIHHLSLWAGKQKQGDVVAGKYRS